MKRIFAITLAIVLCFCVSASALAVGDSESGVQSGQQVAQFAGGDVAVLFVPAYKITVVGTRAEDADKVQLTDVNWTDSLDEREVTANFAYVIQEDGEVVATVYSTVRGVYSQVNNWSEILSITAYITGTNASDYSYSTAKSGNHGYLYIDRSGVRAVTFTYTIATNGNITHSMS